MQPTISVSPTTLSGLKVGVAYSQTVSAAAPTLAGDFDLVTVHAADDEGEPAGEAFYTIAIAPASPPQLSINDVSLSEGNAGPVLFTFTVSLDEPAGFGGGTFDIATVNGTAVGPSGYVAGSASKSISEGGTAVPCQPRR